jgi:hypothetical protein
MHAQILKNNIHWSQKKNPTLILKAAKPQLQKKDSQIP